MPLCSSSLLLEMKVSYHTVLCRQLVATSAAK